MSRSTDVDMAGMTRKMALGSVAAVAVAAVAVTAALGGADDEERSALGGGAAADVRDCAERVEGFGPIVPKVGRDAIVGPIAFIGLPITYRDAAARPDRDDPNIDLTLLKSVLRVKAGQRVRLVVPEDQRGWMRLVYERPKGDGVDRLTVQACPNPPTRRAQRRACSGPGWTTFRACRVPYTEFNGAVGIDFGTAPERGRCAELIVTARGKRPLGKRIFDPAPGECDQLAAGTG